jgi:hypothetical protein
MYKYYKNNILTFSTCFNKESSATTSTLSCAALTELFVFTSLSLGEYQKKQRGLPRPLQCLHRRKQSKRRHYIGDYNHSLKHGGRLRNFMLSVLRVPGSIIYIYK